MRGRVNGADALDQRRVAFRASRRRPFRPRIIAAGGDAQHPAYGDRKNGPVCAHESEPLDGTAFVSRANQAAAFERILRSSLSCLFSLRSRASSLRSALARPSLAAALVAIGLRDPVTDRLRRGLKLFRQLFRRAAGANKFDHLPPELGRYGGRFSCSFGRRSPVARHAVIIVMSVIDKLSTYLAYLEKKAAGLTPFSPPRRGHYLLFAPGNGQHIWKGRPLRVMSDDEIEDLYIRSLNQNTSSSESLKIRRASVFTLLSCVGMLFGLRPIARAPKQDIDHSGAVVRTCRQATSRFP